MVFKVGHSACDHRGGKIQHSGSPCKAAFCDDLGEYAKGAKLIHRTILPHVDGVGEVSRRRMNGGADGLIHAICDKSLYES